MYNENFCIRRIKELMKKNDDTLYRLSKRSGVSLSTLASMFEKNTDPVLYGFDSESAQTFYVVQFSESGASANGNFLFQFFRERGAETLANLNICILCVNKSRAKWQARLIFLCGFLVL